MTLKCITCAITPPLIIWLFPNVNRLPKTRCIALLHDKSLCLELEQRVRAKIKGDKLDLSEKGIKVFHVFGNTL